MLRAVLILLSTLAASAVQPPETNADITDAIITSGEIDRIWFVPPDSAALTNIFTHTDPSDLLNCEFTLDQNDPVRDTATQSSPDRSRITFQHEGRFVAHRIISHAGVDCGPLVKTMVWTGEWSVEDKILSLHLFSFITESGYAKGGEQVVEDKNSVFHFTVKSVEDRLILKFTGSGSRN